MPKKNEIKCVTCNGAGKKTYFIVDGPQNCMACNGTGKREFNENDFEYVVDDDIACPYCGTKNECQFQNDYSLCEDENTELQCSECEKMYKVTCISIIQYFSVEKLEADDEQ